MNNSIRSNKSNIFIIIIRKETRKELIEFSPDAQISIYKYWCVDLKLNAVGVLFFLSRSLALALSFLFGINILNQIKLGLNVLRWLNNTHTHTHSRTEVNYVHHAYYKNQYLLETNYSPIEAFFYFFFFFFYYYCCIKTRTLEVYDHQLMVTTRKYESGSSIEIEATGEMDK